MKRRDEVLVGIVATIALAMGFVGAFWLAQGGLAPGYPLYAKFAWGAGLRQGQPVLLSGVNVGFVEQVAIKTDGMLVVTLRLRNQYKVPKGTTATIEPNGFFGDVLVALHPTKPNVETFAKGDTIPPGRASASVGDVLSRIDTLAANFSVITSAVKREFVDTNGMRDFRVAITSARLMFDRIRQLADSQDAQFTKTQVALRKAASAIDSARIDSTLRSFRATSDSFRVLSTEWARTGKHLDSLISKASTGNGSFAKLMNDPGMYNDMQHAIQRLDSLMTEFQKNPRKFIKLSIF